MNGKIDTTLVREEIERNYPSRIKFNLEVNGDEPLPRSTNISEMRWGGSGVDAPLFIEFFGYQRKDGSRKPNSGYVYENVDVETWYKLVGGKSFENDDPNRRSSGRVFWEEVRNNPEFPFRKVY